MVRKTDIDGSQHDNHAALSVIQQKPAVSVGSRRAWDLMMRMAQYCISRSLCFNKQRDLTKKSTNNWQLWLCRVLWKS